MGPEFRKSLRRHTAFWEGRNAPSGLLRGRPGAILQTDIYICVLCILAARVTRFPRHPGSDGSQTVSVVFFFFLSFFFLSLSLPDLISLSESLISNFKQKKTSFPTNNSNRLSSAFFQFNFPSPPHFPTVLFPSLLPLVRLISFSIFATSSFISLYFS